MRRFLLGCSVVLAFALAACSGVNFVSKAEVFQDDLESLGYNVTEVTTEDEPGQIVLEASVLIDDDASSTSCTVEFERDFYEESSVTVDGQRMKVFWLDEITENGRLPDSAEPSDAPDSPTPGETIEYLMAEYSDLCLTR